MRTFHKMLLALLFVNPATAWCDLNLAVRISKAKYVTFETQSKRYLITVGTDDGQFQVASPRDYFQGAIKKFAKWKASATAVTPFELCSLKLEYQLDKQSGQGLCLDVLPRKAQKEILSWQAQQENFVREFGFRKQL